MTIHIENLKFFCIIGLLDFERVQQQQIIVNLTLTYEYKDNFIDYALLIDLIQEHIISNKFTLLEDAILSLTNLVTNRYLSIKQLSVKITKPTIIPNCMVSVSHDFSYTLI